MKMRSTTSSEDTSSIHSSRHIATRTLLDVSTNEGLKHNMVTDLFSRSQLFKRVKASVFEMILVMSQLYATRRVSSAP
jgi:hypothetical protein